MKDLETEGWHEQVEKAYHDEGQRLWKALLLFSGDPDLSSDAVSEAFAQALARGEVIKSVTAWVWRTAFRVAAGELKARRNVASNPQEMTYEMVDPFPEVLEHLRSLSPRQRAAVVLHHYAGYQAAEIARILGSTPTAIGVHLHRGRRRLRKLLEDGNE